MKNLISNFGQHIKEALATIQASDFVKNECEIQNILICGLGGSGIGGTIIAELANPLTNVPVLVNKDYNIPAFVNEKTLLVACSYSGNTEETLMATNKAIEKGAQVVCITSGGRLLEIAKEHQFNVITIPGGNPPRSMFAYSFSYLTYILSFYDAAGFSVIESLKNSIKLLEDEQENIKQEANKLAEALKDKTAVLYAVSGNLGIASRWRQQLNENAKMLAWEAEIPEMNHNELVGWEGGNSDFVPVFLRNESDFGRNQKRIEIIQEIMLTKTPKVYDVWSKGTDSIQKAFYQVHFGDWVSYYLSELNEVDIIDIKSIDHLKAELSKLPL